MRNIDKREPCVKDEECDKYSKRNGTKTYFLQLQDKMWRKYTFFFKETIGLAVLTLLAQFPCIFIRRQILSIIYFLLYKKFFFFGSEPFQLINYSALECLLED